MAHDARYHEVQKLLRYGAVMAYELDDQSIGHGLIDLTRRARKEIEVIGLRNGHKSVPIESYEGMLLYRVMPEISRRLIQKGGARLLHLPGEQPGPDVTSLTGNALRRLAGTCVAKSAFDIIAEKVRDRFDPEFRNTGTFFACEAVQRDCRSGNILEVALSKLNPPEINRSRPDFFADRISDWVEKCSIHPSIDIWTPAMPEYDIELDDFFVEDGQSMASSQMGPT